MPPALQDAWPHATTLRRDGEFVLLRQRAAQDADAALVLTTASEQAAPKSLERLKHEHALGDTLDPSWAAKPLTLSGERGRCVLLLTDPGGELLSGLLGRPWDTGCFLRVALGMSLALGRVHAQGLIHKDIKPDHVLVDFETGAAWLTGFGIATLLARERQGPDLPETIAGTLAYMAPEQTGRMNRSVDARSDLYALGVTFYQMLTGELPFASSDPMELIHCHIARPPVPPDARASGIPTTVCAIVLKLLEKTAEERYQTAAGVAADLRRCLTQWEAGDGIADFALGLHDMPDRLHIPEKLYGREGEVQTLLTAFDRILESGTPELVLVSGYSGIGKSSVVNELHKVLVPPRGIFASGKFDQYKRDIPYSTLVQAFQSLVRPLLGTRDTELAGWRSALLEALEPNARLMTDLIPELKHIIGEQPPVPVLEPLQAQSRFLLVFRRFIGVFARAEHPLALFLDDLQWLDAATLDLLEDLLNGSELQYLMLIGAYRDNEVDATHPLTTKLQIIRNAGVKIAEITLAPLAREHVQQLIVEALHGEPQHIEPLARLVHDKTAGNPFFVIQFLHALVEEDFLTFSHDAARWRWDPDRIHARGYTDNVVHLMASKLTRLPAPTQHALQQLACLGNASAITKLSTVLGITQAEAHAVLWEAMRHELVERLEGAYAFVHDRVHEAAYSQIPQASRAETHLRIGRLLAERTPPQELEESIFEIAGQLNRGAALITERSEREKLAGFNLLAGKRAKASTAYASALTYLVTGAELVGDDGWDRLHEQMFALELNRAECEFLTGQPLVADERLVTLSDRAVTTIERALVACLQLDVYLVLDQSDRAVAVCLAFLRHVGIEWSAHPSDEEVRREYDRIWTRLGERTIEDLVDLPLMEDPASLGTLEALSKLFAPALQTDANLACLLICKAVILSLERGNCDASCVLYANVGRVAGRRFGDYAAGYRFGQLACELVDRRGLRRFEAKTFLCFSIFVVRWMKPVRVCRDLLRRAYAAANRIGDLPYGAYAGNSMNSDLLFAGESLPQVQAEAERGLLYAEKVRFGLVIDFIGTQLALIRMLRGLTPTFGCLDDGPLTEHRTEEHLASNPGLALAACWYFVRKMQACYLAGHYPAAMKSESRAKELLWTATSFFEEAEFYFFGALTHAALCESSPASERSQHLDAIAAYRRQLQTWSDNCPENFGSRTALVSAEIARVEGRVLDAEQLYEQAIDSARESGFVHIEALANEVASRFYAARGLEKIARAYLRDARYGYLRWGADGKVRQLDESHPGLREEERSIPATVTARAAVEGLDIATVIKVSQALSGEVVLEKMLDTLMRIAIEHAGAGRGLLILARPGEHLIVAQATADGSGVDVQMRNDAATSGHLPQSVYQYVLRTHQSVILDDAAALGPYTADPYIREQRSRSVLCLPLLKQSALIGVLLLENPLATRAFTPTRIAVLDMVASQAAIALENARLYADLQKAHRLEAMGTLAGGIAHDFNNILGAILGYGEVALREARPGTQLRRDLEAILLAGERGRALVERVLAFSRSGVAEHVAVHVEQVVREALDMLAAKLPQTVRLETQLAAGRAALIGDTTQVHQVVMNLCTNAAHAMPDGGVLAVTLCLERIETFRSAAIGHIDEGEYLVLRVSDTGRGIPAPIVERIFEPFFTTKQGGMGTGLGLSLVHGIVTLLGGAIEVASAVGQGSTFTVYLPRTGDAVLGEDSVEPELPRGQGQCVLVVDDDELLVELAARTLENLGYDAVGFTSGSAALATLRAEPHRFDAVITDERMPQISGGMLIEAVREIHPSIPIVLTSGFVGGGLEERARAAGADEVLKKPLRAHDIATCLARLLDSKK